MGFYGNISNATRTQFSFDRVYSNRRAMEALQTTDGVYAGRYVLVEYDQDTTEDCFRKVTKTTSGLYYSDGEYANAQLNKSNTSDKQIVYVENASTKKKEFYIIRHNNGSFKYENVAANESNYVVNYNVDLTYYFESAGGRGYDSTVWQKVYTEGTEKYVMVAELNTVVPTFEITADSPSMSPRLPHFDADSTNVYYKLHWQPQWGVRVKGAKNYKTPKLNSDGTQVSVKDADGKEVITYVDASTDAVNYPSDMYTTWSRSEYNRVNNEEKVYYATENANGNGVTWSQDFSQTLPGAIYFNKAGFDPSKITYFKDHYNLDNPNAPTTYTGGNKIALQPTGMSGHQYNTHGLGFDPEVEEDIQELSIMLPGVGDAVATLWDIAYGGEAINYGRNRNRDISWNSTRGHRLVSNRADGNGFEYNDDERVETIAGCINSVHDLMGMIITNLGDSKPNDASNLQDNQIYYFNGEYLRKKEIFDYNPEGVQYIYEDIEKLTASDYEPGTYFIKNGNDYIKDSDSTFDANKKYAVRKITVGNWTTIQPPLQAWQPNTYYTKSLSGNYYLAKDQLASHEETYYSIDLATQSLGQDYYPDQFHYIDENENYMFSRDESLTEGREYFQVGEDKFLDNTAINYWNILPFEKGKYVYKFNQAEIDANTNPDKEIKPVWKIENGDIQPDRQYYIATIQKITDNTYQENEDGEYVPVVLETIIISNEREVTLIDLGDKNKKYFIKEPVTKVNPETQLDEIINYNYIKVTAPIYDNWGNLNTQIKYYEGIDLDTLAPITSFYQPNKFYYKDLNQNYIKDTGATARPNTTYYLITDTKQNPFYVPYIYYYYNKDTKKYEIDTRWEKCETDYYTGGDYYVENDDKKVFAQGALWNNNVKIIPSSITLATRDSHFELAPLIGFARTLNTIHGLILKVNDMLEMDDVYTRNTSTVQGVINRLNDVLVKFDELIPREFLIVDDYGRAHSADFTTDQTTSKTLSKKATFDSLTKGIIADKFDEVKDENSPTQWITVNIDGNPIEPKVTLHHNFNPVTNRNTTSDKNIETRVSSDTGIHNNGNDDLVIYSPIVDQMGHIVGTKTDTVTLPYGFKYFKTNGLNAATTDIDPNGSTEIIANSTQDTLEINSFNKWIQTRLTPSANDTNDILEIAHEVHPITTTDKTSTNLNNPAEDTITIQDLVFDEAGHVTANQKHKYTLPFGFKKIVVDTPSGNNTTDYSTANNSDIVADNTQSTLTIKSDNDWIRVAGDKDSDTLTFAHQIHNITTSPKTSTDLNNVGTKSFTVQDLIFDTAGHVTANQTHEYILPLNFKQVTIGAESTGNDNATHTQGNLIADSHVDTLIITPFNRWIRLSADVNNGSFTIGHSYAGSDSGRLYGNSEAKSPQFGGTFKVPYIGVDDAGHINTQNHYDITIPKPSLSTSGSTTTGASLVTDISLTPETGAFSETRANVGTLTLSGYSLGTDTTAITDNDSINGAFSKLQAQINTEAKTRQKAITDLQQADTAVVGQYVSAVSQNNGIITVNRENLPDYSNTYAPLEGSINTSSEFNYSIGADENAQKTIEWLFKKVADLENRLNEFTTV